MKHAPYILAFLALLPATTAAAQSEIVTTTNPDADRLAADVRILGADPMNVAALVSAGENAIRVGDLNAAAAFFARANAIDPRNARVKAGEATLLVQLQRPGEALRMFQEAERLGLAATYFAANRGLAFDLLGEQERAQQDYKLALTRERSDETSRRYALSLGISGDRDAAFAQIDGLLRKSDRAAWRIRAFIMAMTGDVRGADTIARSMLGPGMASGFAPFFARLPTLGSADRAYAVHFGEVGRTAVQIADARGAPALPPIVRAAAAPVRVASAPARTTKPSQRELRREAAARRDAERAEQRSARARPAVRKPVEVASVTPRVVAPVGRRAVAARPVPVPAPTSTPASAGFTMPAAPVVRDLPPAAIRQSEQAIVARGVTLSDMSPRVAGAPLASPVPVPVPAGAPAAVVEPARATLPPVAVMAATPVPSAVAASPAAGSGFAAAPDVTSAPAPMDTAAQPAAPAVAIVAPAALPPATPPVVPATAVAAPVTLAPANAPPAAATSAPAVAATPVPVPTAQRGSDLLAAIVAGIAIPASELGVAPMPGDVPPPAFGGGADEPSEPIARVVEARPEVPTPVAREIEAKPETPKPVAKVTLRAKPTPAKPKPEVAVEARRHWAQVAGGADTGALPREWRRLRDKSPAAFKPLSAWTTPLRATNRLLAGPFETVGAAQSFVNEIARDGITAFVFTSAVGQKITKLPIK